MSALSGRNIIVTRAPHQAEELAQVLRTRGAVPLLYPCIDIVPPDDCDPLDAALRAVAKDDYDWLILTSVNTVRALAARLKTLDLPPTSFSSLEIAAVGPATAAACHALLAARADLVPDEFSASALAELLHTLDQPRVLLPQSSLAENELAATLAAQGAAVTAVVAYQTGMGTGGVDLPALLAGRGVAAVTLTSASTVTNLLRRLTAEGGKIDALRQVCLACIGASTAAAVRQHGLSVAVVPPEHTLGGLVAGLERYFQQAREEHGGHDTQIQ